MRTGLLMLLALGSAAAQPSALLPKRDLSKYMARPQLIQPLKQQLAKTREWLIAKDERCAHILTFVPPADLDTGMVIRPGGASASMKTEPPMPVCPEDVRQLPDRNRR